MAKRTSLAKVPNLKDEFAKLTSTLKATLEVNSPLKEKTKKVEFERYNLDNNKASWRT